MGTKQIILKMLPFLFSVAVTIVSATNRHHYRSARSNPTSVDEFGSSMAGQEVRHSECSGFYCPKFDQKNFRVKRQAAPDPDPAFEDDEDEDGVSAAPTTPGATSAASAAAPATATTDSATASAATASATPVVAPAAAPTATDVSPSVPATPGAAPAAAPYLPTPVDGTMVDQYTDEVPLPPLAQIYPSMPENFPYPTLDTVQQAPEPTTGWNQPQIQSSIPAAPQPPAALLPVELEQPWIQSPLPAQTALQQVPNLETPFAQSVDEYFNEEASVDLPMKEETAGLSVIPQKQQRPAASPTTGGGRTLAQQQVSNLGTPFAQHIDEYLNEEASVDPLKQRETAEVSVIPQKQLRPAASLTTNGGRTPAQKKQPPAQQHASNPFAQYVDEYFNEETSVDLPMQGETVGVNVIPQNNIIPQLRPAASSTTGVGVSGVPKKKKRPAQQHELNLGIPFEAQIEEQFSVEASVSLPIKTKAQGVRIIPEKQHHPAQKGAPNLESSIDDMLSVEAPVIKIKKGASGTSKKQRPSTAGGGASTVPKKQHQRPAQQQPPNLGTLIAPPIDEQLFAEASVSHPVKKEAPGASVVPQKQQRPAPSSTAGGAASAFPQMPPRLANPLDRPTASGPSSGRAPQDWRYSEQPKRRCKTALKQTCRNEHSAVQAGPPMIGPAMIGPSMDGQPMAAPPMGHRPLSAGCLSQPVQPIAAAQPASSPSGSDPWKKAEQMTIADIKFREEPTPPDSETADSAGQRTRLAIVSLALAGGLYLLL